MSQGFTNNEIAQLIQTRDAFTSSIETRGQSGYAGWGGSITFDTDADWHYDHTTNPPSDELDFITVALHELIHAVGFGTSDEWDSLVFGNLFTGAASAAEFGSSVPLHSDLGHWRDGTASTVFGGTELQETILDPTISRGVR